MATKKTKQCKDCNNIVPLSGFYGVQGECKLCTRKRVAERVERLNKDPKWVIKERARHRAKSRKYRDDGRAKPNQRSGPIDPTKKKANTKASNAIRDGRLIKEPCMVCGETKAHAHHEDYSKPLDVHWLCIRHHNDRHIYLRDQEILGLKPLPIKHQFASNRIT